MSKIINIISGKGGTGKTLLTAVLAELLGNIGEKVLVVDLDVFVRGLTTLLYYQKNEVIKIIDSQDLSVSDFFKSKEVDGEVSICRYRSFDVLPSVSTVDEILNFRDIMPNSVMEAEQILNRLLESIDKKYDYIFFDSRAGYDELIAAAHRVSNFSICVEEDDNISIVTADNLIAQLKYDSNHPVLRIRNKVRKYTKETNSVQLGIAFVGNIPFDADVMNSFGTDTFWSDIGKTMYVEALCEAWNNLAAKMDLRSQLKNKRISPIVSVNIERKISMLSTFKRISFVYGIILIVLGYYLTIEGDMILEWMRYEPSRLVGILGVVMGIILVATSIIKRE